MAYKCSFCGTEYRRPQFGACINCGGFQTVEEVEDVYVGVRTGAKSGGVTAGSISSVSACVPLGEVKVHDSGARLSSGYGECDRVLGGGFVNGEVVMLAAPPGAGKSTLCLGIAGHLSSVGETTVYLSGEESAEQIALRAERMMVDTNNIFVAHGNRAEDAVAHCEDYKPTLCIVDSVQMLTVDGVTSQAGSVAQSKAATTVLTEYAKRSGVVMILISQVVKNGDFAGSEAGQHIVDATLKFDVDDMSPLRFLRAIKNRFGSVDEVGVFQHVDTGLVEVTDPTALTVDTETTRGASGTALTMLAEGTRFFPVEVQALAVPSALASPRKQFFGVQAGKVHGVCAIIDKFCQTGLSAQDIYVSTVANVKIDSPTCDTAIAAALITSHEAMDMPTDGFCYLGEVSLTGSIRSTSLVTRAAKEAYRLGDRRIVVPAGAKKDVMKALKDAGATSSMVKVYGVSTIKDLYKLILSEGHRNNDEKKLLDKLNKQKKAQLYAKQLRESGRE